MLAVDTLCGSSAFTGTMKRIDAAAIALRMVTNEAALHALDSKMAGRSPNRDEEERGAELDNALYDDRQALRAAVKALTGIDPDTLARLL